MTPKDFIKEGVEYDNDGQIIWAINKKEGLQMLLQLRGWGAIQNLFKKEEQAENFQDELGEWIAEAINEKLEREKK